MPQCIFCSRQTPHEVAQGRSVCLDCLVELRRFEVQNLAEVTRRIYPEDFCEALARVGRLDPDHLSEEDLRHIKSDMAVIRKHRPL